MCDGVGEMKNLIHNKTSLIDAAAAAAVGDTAA